MKCQSLSVIYWLLMLCMGDIYINLYIVTRWYKVSPGLFQYQTSEEYMLLYINHIYIWWICKSGSPCATGNHYNTLYYNSLSIHFC